MTHSAQNVCLQPLGVPSSWSLNLKRQIVQDSSGLSLSDEETCPDCPPPAPEEEVPGWGCDSSSSDEDERSLGFFLVLFRLMGDSSSVSFASVGSSSPLDSISMTFRLLGRRVIIGLLKLEEKSRTLKPI